MEPSDKKSNKRLEFDWSKLLGDSDDPPPEVILTSSTADAESRNSSENLTAAMDSDRNALENVETMSDKAIDSWIEKYANMKKSAISQKLPDHGAKLDVLLKRLEAEKKRRRLLPVEKGQKEFVIIKQSANMTKNCYPDASDAISKDQTLSNEGLQSSFTSLFSKRLDNVDSRSKSGFGKVSSKPSNADRHRNQFKWGSFARDINKASSRHKPFQSPILEKSNHRSSGDRRGIVSDTNPVNLSETSNAKKRNDHFMCSNDSKPAQSEMVVLDEEDEDQLEIIEHPDEVAEDMEDATIYYPSRDDPDSVEICYKDKKCLDPEGYLTSPIMNFYIAYLQQQASFSNKRISDYHFFNTYFYKKLQDAVSDKETGKDVSFAKLRRWWKGVNIFEKAYLLIPIHENLHWSLAIICIPDKQDESGPVILHLDSLELHRSKPIFDNIKSFLVEEWSYLNEQSASFDLLIVDQVWERLPGLISVKTISVPQQKNDYDCGLFVLYFMQRFMEVAPERLKKKDLDMFGKRWFKPEEASSLRSKIRRLLIKEFRKAHNNLGSDGKVEAV